MTKLFSHNAKEYPSNDTCNKKLSLATASFLKLASIGLIFLVLFFYTHKSIVPERKLITIILRQLAEYEMLFV